MSDQIRLSLPASGIRKIFDKAAQLEKAGRNILHLEIGRPDFEMAPGLAESVKQSIDEGFIHYIANRGLMELREKIADEIKSETGRQFDPESELIITTGASEGLAMCCLALLGPGDEMIVPEPAWPHYRAAALMSGAEFVSLPTLLDNKFVIDPDMLRKHITEKTKIVVLNTPSNPTGAVQPVEVLKAISSLSEKYGFYILADEVYKHFVYEGEHVSMLSVCGNNERLVYLDSMSKSYGMTGWRIGYVAATRELSDALNRVHQYLTVCGVSFAQKGACVLFTHPERNSYLNRMKEEFKNRRQVWIEGCKDHPAIELGSPKGAFYLFPKIEYKNMPCEMLCDYLLEQHDVATVPGTVFGKGYERHVRISYGKDLETQREAVARVITAFAE
ncbi:pyridoxal phosphate-dependent aminotransferase [Fibrobacterota bacterium]